MFQFFESRHCSFLAEKNEQLLRCWPRGCSDGILAAEELRNYHIISESASRLSCRRQEVKEQDEGRARKYAGVDEALD